MPPPASDLAIYRAFRDDLLACGVPQVSIEPQTGRSGRWVSRGSHGGTSFVVCLGHHIASFPTAARPTPGLSVVKNGRPGLNGPLANAYGGMDLIARIICLDWANHPGEGGPWTIDGFRIPRDGGRPYLLGWEHEGGFSNAVWDTFYTNKATGKRMTYREFMGRCHAGTLRFLGRPRTSFGEHSTWADLKQRGRKVDRLNYGHPVGTPATRGINELTPHYLNPEDDMPTTDEIVKALIPQVRSVVQQELARNYTHPGPPETTVSTRHGGRYGFLASRHAQAASLKADAILEVVQGGDGSAILARINEIAEQETIDREELGAQLGEVRTLVADLQAGRINVGDFLRRTGEALVSIDDGT